MTVDDWTPECCLVSVRAIGPQGQVPACHFPLEFSFVGVTENGDAELFNASDVFIHLPGQTFVTVFVGNVFEDLIDEFSLLVGVKVFAERWTGNVPVCMDALLTSIAVWETQSQQLSIGKRSVELLDGAGR